MKHSRESLVFFSVWFAVILFTGLGLHFLKNEMRSKPKVSKVESNALGDCKIVTDRHYENDTAKCIIQIWDDNGQTGQIMEREVQQEPVELLHKPVEITQPDYSQFNVKPYEGVELQNEQSEITTLTLASKQSLNFISTGAYVSVMSDQEAYEKCEAARKPESENLYFIGSKCSEEQSVDGFKRLIGFFMTEADVHPEETKDILDKLRITIHYEDGRIFGYEENNH